ncbi:hypothetical protein OIV83_006352 [Microbotryomycetes sp. JL201]|nr:hypothetical protein OIV83_006352 [Microbotryomycetes sp. JL201]
MASRTGSSDRLEMIFLGTGTSATVPSIQCLTDPKRGCWCCRSTLDPTNLNAKRNVRKNTSAVLRIPSKGNDAVQRRKTLLIDCGKSFLSSALEHWPKHGLREIDALLITHAHADAMLGLDDLRGWTLHGTIQKSVPIYCTQDTYDEIAKCFPYLTDSMKATGGGDVPAFEWRIFDGNQPFDILGVHVVPLPVHHGKIFSRNGEPYYCMGYLFDRQIAYLSDVSLIPEDVWDVLAQELELPTGNSVVATNGLRSNGAVSRTKRPLPMLVVDCLRIETFTSHFGFGEAVAAARRMGAQRTYMASAGLVILSTTCSRVHMSQVGFGHYVSHDCWVNTCEQLQKGARTTLPVDPNVRLPIEKEKWRVMNGSPDPTREDWSVHSNYALRAVESFEGGYFGGLWIRPACDGMTVAISETRATDDVYDI